MHYRLCQDGEFLYNLIPIRINYLRIHSGKGFIGSFTATWCEWSWIADPNPDHPNGTHPKRILEGGIPLAAMRWPLTTIELIFWQLLSVTNFHKKSSCFLTLKCPTHSAWLFTNLWKPFRLLHLLNEAQVCLCTGTSSSLELLETCSHCPDVRKLGKNTLVNAIPHLVQLWERCYYSVSDTGSPEEKIWVLPVGDEPVTFRARFLKGRLALIQD